MHRIKVLVDDGRRLVPRHDPTTGAWELAAAYGGGPGVWPGRAAVVRI